MQARIAAGRCTCRAVTASVQASASGSRSRIVSCRRTSSTAPGESASKQEGNQTTDTPLSSPLPSTSSTKQRTSSAPRRRESKSWALRKLRPQPFDYSERDPVRELHRLSTSETPTSKFAQFGSALGLPASWSSRHRNEQEVRDHNRAVQNVYQGIDRGNWDQAWVKGWKVLHAKGDNAQDSLHMYAAEGIARMAVQLPPEQFDKEWETVRDALLVSLAVRECRLASADTFHSVVASWIWTEVRKHTPEANERVRQFWTSFIRALQNDESRARRENKRVKGAEPVTMPLHLFTAVLTAHCLSEAVTLQQFIATFSIHVSVPKLYVASSSLGSALKLLDPAQPFRAPRPPRRPAYGSSQPSENDISHRRTVMTPSRLDEQQVNRNKLELWFRQMELVRIWSRSGEYGIRLQCMMWRERRHEKAVLKTWEAIKEAVSPKDGLKAESWMRVDWLDAQTPRGEESAAEDGLAGELSPGQTIGGHIQMDDKNRHIEDGSSAHRFFNARPAVPPALLTPELCSELVHTFLYIGMPEQAQDVWDFLSKLGYVPSLSMWTAIMSGQARQRDPEAVQDTLKRMEAAGVKPDGVCWSILINAYFRAGLIEEGLQKTQQLLENQDLKKRHHGHRLPTQVYNVILNALYWNDKVDAAQELFARMRSDGVNPDIFTINIMLRHYSRPRTHNLQGISDTFKLVQEYALTPDIVTFTTILDAFLRAGRTDAIERIQRIMSSMSVKANAVTYGALIDHLVKSSVEEGSQTGLLQAVQLLRQMQSGTTGQQGEPEGQTSDIKPTEQIYTTIIQAFARYSITHRSPSHLQQAEQILREMEEVPLPPNRIILNSLMAANLAHKYEQRALQHFERYRALKKRRSAGTGRSSEFVAMTAEEQSLIAEHVPLRTWQGLLAGLLSNESYSVAREVIAEMKEVGVDFSAGALRNMEQRALSESRK